MATFYYPESFRASSLQWNNAPLRRFEVLEPTSVADGDALAPALPNAAALGDAPFYHLNVSLVTTDDPSTARGNATVTLQDGSGNDVGSYVVTASGSNEPLRIDPSQVAAIAVDVSITGGGNMNLSLTASIPTLDAY